MHTMTRLIVSSAVVAVLMASGVDAFTVRPNKHMQPPSIYHGITTTTTTPTKTLTANTTGKVSSSFALQMNLFDRFSRVAKSNLNNILQSLEDPEKIMTQALEDMQVRPRY